jgi:hypothetical protein
MMSPVITKVSSKTSLLQVQCSEKGLVAGECTFIGLQITREGSDPMAPVELAFDQNSWMLAGSLENSENHGNLMGFPLSAGYLNLPEFELRQCEMAWHNLSALQRVRVKPAASSLKTSVTM